MIWDQFAEATLEAVAALLFRLEPEVVLVPGDQIIGTPRFTIHVAPVCSGFESIGLVLVFLGLFVGVARRELRLPRVWLLFPIAVVLAWALNAVRIAMLLSAYITSAICTPCGQRTTQW